MGEITGIAWTDSTMNFWEGCTKVGPGCDHCYAETRDKRFHGGSHWGPGAPRRQMSQHTRNNPHRWQKGAAEFKATHGHPQRVFCSSLADIFDNEVDQAWRDDAFATMEATPDLRWQLCTKRVSNIAKMIPDRWTAPGGWPSNVGVLITTVTAAEIARDVPRLVDLKDAYKVPWVGLSIEPMIEDVMPALFALKAMIRDVDWIIIGGESGDDARPCDIGWMAEVIHGSFDLPGWPAIFVKQLGAKPMRDGVPFTLKDAAGGDVSEWPFETLKLRQFPRALCE